MASNYTEHYGLCQWEATDQVLRTEFNEDNRKIEAALSAKLGRGEIIQEIFVSSDTNGIDVDLSGINWNEWEYISVTLACARDDDNSTGVMYFDLNGIFCYGSMEQNLGKRVPGPLLVLFPILHNANRPIRMVIFPGGDLAFSDTTFQSLRKFRLNCSGSYSEIPAGAKVWVEGVR